MKISKEDAIFLAGTNWWVGRPAREVALFQMDARLLCMPFDEFHKSLEDALGRPVWTHEMGMNWEGLRKELLGERPAPSFDEVVALIPKEKLIVIHPAAPR